MRGYGFTDFKPNQIPKGGFEELLKLFLELLNYTSGDAGEALAWLNELDKKYKDGHEAHFGRVTEKYLGYLRDGNMPKWEVPNMIAKYYTTTSALELANRSK